MNNSWHRLCCSPHGRVGAAHALPHRLGQPADGARGGVRVRGRGRPERLRRVLLAALQAVEERQHERRRVLRRLHRHVDVDARRLQVRWPRLGEGVDDDVNNVEED